MGIKKAETMHKTSVAAAAKYPWGLTREQALARGWQSSGFGEVNWNKKG